MASSTSSSRRVVLDRPARVGAVRDDVRRGGPEVPGVRARDPESLPVGAGADRPRAPARRPWGGGARCGAPAEAGRGGRVGAGRILRIPHLGELLERTNDTSLALLASGRSRSRGQLTG